TRIANDLIEYGVVHRPRLGVQIRNATAADAEVFGLDAASGAVVAAIEDGTPAQRPGIRLGDVIRAVDGEPVGSVAELQDRIARRRPGDRVRLGIIRYGDSLDVDVRLGEFEAQRRVARSTDEDREAGTDRLGLRTDRLTPELARELGIEAGADKGGVVITAVRANSDAARAGISAGMVIESVNGREVSTPDELDRVLRDLPAGRAVSLIVRLPTGDRTIINFRPRS